MTFDFENNLLSCDKNTRTRSIKKPYDCRQSRGDALQSGSQEKTDCNSTQSE